MGNIVDVDGRPIDMGVLTEELAGPQITGVRQVWQNSVAAGMTPEELVRVLEGSINSDPRAYLKLAEEMEEREGHYFSVLGTRKLAVESVPVVVEAVSDDAADVKIADAVRDLFKLECVDESRADVLDALGKSYCVSEIVWDTSEKQWQPKAIKYRDPTWFQFDRDTLTEIRLRDQADLVNGIALAPFKYIVHRPKLKSGLPIRNGLARIAAFAFICKAYAMKDWLAFAEVMGMPVRVGRYGPNASGKDIATLRRAVANIGTDAACVIPESMKIEFEEAGNVGSSAGMFETLCNYLDKQISKIVIGQTMSADAQSTGMNSGNADVHNEVRGDIRDADGKQLAATYRRDLVRAFVDLNFGPQKRYPMVTICKPKQEDIRQLTESLKVLVPMGLRVEQSVVRDRLGIPDPAETTSDGKPIELLMAPTSAPSPAADLNPADLTALNRVLKRALNAVQSPEIDTPDLQVQRLAADAAPAFGALLDPIQQILEESTSFDDFKAKILEAWPDMPTEELSGLIAEGLAAAHMAGRYELLVGR